jgi:hypothetical protein
VASVARSKSFGSRRFFFQVDRQDLLADLACGQVDEEDLVEAALPEQFGRQHVDPVGGGDDEHRITLLLHPREQRADDPRGGAAVGLVGAAHASEALLDLVDPQHAGASACATCSASRMLPSDWPTMPPNTLPMSKRSSGNCQVAATALASRLLPQP